MRFQSIAVAAVITLGLVPACHAQERKAPQEKLIYRLIDSSIAKEVDKKDCDGAFRDAERALSLTRPPLLSWLDAIRARGRVYKNCWGRYEEALADFQEGLRQRPDVYLAYPNLAEAYLAMGQFARAVATYDKALEVVTAGIKPRLRRGQDVHAGASADEREDLQAIFENRGYGWLNLGDAERALADFDASLRFVSSKQAPYVYAKRGDAWRLRGDLKRSLDDINKALAADGMASNALFLVKRSNTYRYMGENAFAIADASHAIRVGPDFAAAYVSRGLAQERAGNPVQAREDFEKSLSFPLVRYDTTREAQATARARLAALGSGQTQPVIPAAPAVAAHATSIPTPALSRPAPPVNAASSAQGRRVALVIGNSAYRSVAPLANPQRDTEAVAATLRNIGFDIVSVAADATRERVDAALRTFADEAEKADWAMVYYAGHGIEVGGTNYLVPVDARLAADRDVQFEAVPLDRVMAAVEGARKLRLIVLDACRDNPFTAQMRRTSAPDALASGSTAGAAVATRSLGRGLANMSAGVARQATLVVYAAKHGQTALDGEGANSPFAVAFVQRIATPGVEINKIFRLVRDDVMEMTAGRQEPFTYGSLSAKEDFFFVAVR
jgi:tetratricopeptide (TPR) repeat protein